jgi:hypothetical protein
LALVAATPKICGAGCSVPTLLAGCVGEVDDAALLESELAAVTAGLAGAADVGAAEPPPPHPARIAAMASTLKSAASPEVLRFFTALLSKHSWAGALARRARAAPLKRA